MSNASVIEAMLLRWGEGPTGRTVTLLLPDDTPHHPFKGLRSGPSNGQRLGCAFTLIADDETTTPVDTAPQAPEKPKGGDDASGVELPKPMRLAQQAGMVCGDVRFRRFLEEKYHAHCRVTVEGFTDAAETVRVLCGVGSRKQFDTDPAAAQRWHNLHGEYIAWREAA